MEKFKSSVIYHGQSEIMESRMWSFLDPKMKHIVNNSTDKLQLAIGAGGRLGDYDIKLALLICYKKQVMLIVADDTKDIGQYLYKRSDLFDTEEILNEIIRALLETVNGVIDKVKQKLSGEANVYQSGNTNIKPTSDSKELTTFTGLDCMERLVEWVPKREDFILISKKILTSSQAIVILMHGENKNTNEDAKFMVVTRIGEPTPNPVEANLLGMIAYQPEVLKNGIMFNPNISDKIKEAFELQFSEYFNN